jgi:6-pyruvoyltetrahydropterin/6-carboxytetrahydropterin synthase
MKVKVSRKAHFNAAHRLHHVAWSAEQNAEVFGKCAYPNYHGHNYELIASVTGEVDPITGFVMNVTELAAIIKAEVEDPLDHRNLNLDVPHFASVNPTAENIAIFIWHAIQKRLQPDLELEVILYETPRNFVTYTGA